MVNLCSRFVNTTKTRRVALLAALPLLMMNTGLAPHAIELCQGFVEENDMRIPVGVRQEGGITEEEFNAVLDQFEAEYKDRVAAHGGILEVRRKWSDPTVNASAQQSGNKFIVNMFGGLARHKVMNKDGFMLVACHEVGHHIGGAPKTGWFNSWASNEGQSDYYASLRCLRHVWSAEENSIWYSENESTINPVSKETCEGLYNTQEEEVLCIRTAEAGRIAGLMFMDLRKETIEPKFDTPDLKEVSRTDDRHPATQCRMDTYYQGALCVHDMNEELSQQDPVKGTCTSSIIHSHGLRPRCWYKPL